MNAGIVLSFHGSLQAILEKTGGDTGRITEFLVFRKFSKSFGRVFVFSHDSKDYSLLMPENFTHVNMHSRLFYIAFGWLVVLVYALRYRIRIFYAECGPALPPLFLVNKLSGAKVMLNYDNTWFLCASGLKRRLLKRLERFLLSFVDYFVISSTEIAEFVGIREGILPIRKGLVLREFDPAHVKPNAIYKDVHGRILVFTGRLHPVKDPITMMKAYSIAKKRVKDLRLIVAGEGELRKECEAIADSDVHFIGFVSDVPSILKGADLFVLPSAYDASPRSLMEAMAMGLPSVATKVGGIPDFLDESCGILIEPGKPKLLAEKIVYLLGRPSLMKAMGKKAREKMLKHHDLDRNLDWAIRFLKEATG